jgi:hypothetical protein
LGARELEAEDIFKKPQKSQNGTSYTLIIEKAIHSVENRNSGASNFSKINICWIKKQGLAHLRNAVEAKVHFGM